MKKSANKSNSNKRSLHVLFTGSVYPKVITGGDQLFIDIAPRLPKNINITIIAPHFAKDYFKNLDTNVRFILLPKNRFEYRSNPLFIFASYVIRSWQVYRILKHENVQNIYSCSDIAYADIWPAYVIAKKNKNINWISRIYHVILPPRSRQGNFFTNLAAFRLQRMSFWMMKKQSSTIMPLNKKLYDEVLELDFPPKKLHILGVGIDFQAINNHKISKKYKYDVVVLARVAPVKGIYDSIKIWERVHAELPDVKLAWIGGGSDTHQKKVGDLIKEKALENSYSLLGFIDKDKVYDILHSAKLFLCIDHENGWGLAVCEAMSSGLPVVSYNLDIFGSVYTKGFTSVNLYDTESFSNEVIRLLKDEHARKIMSIDATEQVKKFDHKLVIDNLVRYIS
jgi:glycosyltransferase involved in cell wall biosynthesis